MYIYIVYRACLIQHCHSDKVIQYRKVGIYLPNMKTLIKKDICTLMFIAALFTIAKKRKQPMSINR